MSGGHEPCFSASPRGGHLCQKRRGHEGKHHASFPGGSEQWEEEEAREPQPLSKAKWAAGDGAIRALQEQGLTVVFSPRGQEDFEDLLYDLDHGIGADPHLSRSDVSRAERALRELRRCLGVS